MLIEEKGNVGPEKGPNVEKLKHQQHERQKIRPAWHLDNGPIVMVTDITIILIVIHWSFLLLPLTKEYAGTRVGRYDVYTMRR